MHFKNTVVTQRKIRATNASIRHWEENLRFAEQGKPLLVTLGIQQCALCQLPSGCNGCPVFLVSGNTCTETPYYDVCSERYLAVNDPFRSLDALKEAIRRELEFLKTVRKHCILRSRDLRPVVGPQPSKLKTRVRIS